MNIAQAKQIPLETILKHLQAEETKASADRSEIWYKSPFREEKAGSFKVDSIKNVWYDHGAGRGGDIIKLVTERHQMTVSEALKWIKGCTERLPPIQPVKRTTAQPKAEEQPDGFLLVKEKELSSRGLVDYVRFRGITPELAQKHFQEIHFTTRKARKSLYGIGFKNDSDGWEVRGAVGDLKSCIGHKDISTIYPRRPAASLDVFEGFFDYATRLEMGPTADDQAFMVMNTASLVDRAIERIQHDPQLAQVKIVRLWLDNDKTGEEITHKMALALHECRDVGDMRENYVGPDRHGDICKDLNQWWTDCPKARHGASPKVYNGNSNAGLTTAMIHANKSKPLGPA